MRTLSALVLFALSLSPSLGAATANLPAPSLPTITSSDPVVVDGPALNSVKCPFWRWADVRKYMAYCK